MMIWEMNIQATKPGWAARRFRSIVVILPMVAALGCSNAANDANRRQVEQNQALIEQSQRELAMLKAQQNNPPTPSNTGGCDKGVEATATHRGGDALASGDMTKALGYYQDALTACPSSSKADMNLARVYETLDNRDTAIRYYRAAASATDSDGHSAKDAQAALSRLGAH
jgi:tetratricopeptide (TPR) repeat protein